MDRSFLTVFGHTAIDVILQVDERPKLNTSTPINKRSIRWGGTGANISKNAAQLGVPTRLASFVGEDFDVEYKRSLIASGVNISDLKEMEGFGTPTCFIISIPSEEQMALMDQGVMDHISEFEIDDKPITDSNIVHIGTGDPEYYKRVMNKALKEGKTIAFDPSQELRYVYQPEIFETMLSMSSYFFCNSQEYKRAAEYIGAGSTDDFFSFVDVMIVTHGSKGSTLFTEGEEIKIPAYRPDKVVDPTGAGDAYRAGFYAGLYRDLPLELCCRCGALNSSFSLGYAGPQEAKVTWDDIWEVIASD